MVNQISSVVRLKVGPVTSSGTFLRASLRAFADAFALGGDSTTMPVAAEPLVRATRQLERMFHGAGSSLLTGLGRLSAPFGDMDLEGDLFCAVDRDMSTPEGKNMKTVWLFLLLCVCAFTSVSRASAAICTVTTSLTNGETISLPTTVTVQDVLSSGHSIL